jgi:hypothetical protein
VIVRGSVAGPPKIDLTPGHPTILLEITPVNNYIGPSAGAAFLVAMTALVTGCTVNTDAGVTGEVCIDGRLLKVGDIAQKAHAIRAVSDLLYVPLENADEDISRTKTAKRKRLRVKGCRHVETVLDALLVKPSPRVKGEQGLHPASAVRRASASDRWLAVAVAQPDAMTTTGLLGKATGLGCAELDGVVGGFDHVRATAITAWLIVPCLASRCTA